MTMGYVTTKNEAHKTKVVVHALGGVGKSTFGVHAAKHNNGIIILGEDGIDKISEADGVPRVMPTVWDYSTAPDVRDKEIESGVISLKKVLKDLMVEKHVFGAVVIDTMDSFIPMLDTWTVKNNYGGDFKKADAYKSKYNDYVREMQAVLSALEYCKKKRGMEIVLLVHSVVNNHRDPSSEAWKRWELNLPGGDKTNLGAIVYDWADVVLYGAYDIMSEDKSKNRVAYSEWTPVYDAKNRIGIPEVIDFDYKSFKTAEENANAKK